MYIYYIYISRRYQILFRRDQNYLIFSIPIAWSFFFIVSAEFNKDLKVILINFRIILGEKKTRKTKKKYHTFTVSLNILAHTDLSVSIWLTEIFVRLKSHFSILDRIVNFVLSDWFHRFHVDFKFTRVPGKIRAKTYGAKFLKYNINAHIFITFKPCQYIT